MDFYNNKKVLITGGAGFIGSHLAEKLAFSGAHIVVLDDLSTGKLENLKHVLPCIELIKGDITDQGTCLRATKDVCTIFHHAALISVPETFKDPERCFDVNIRGTEKILDAAINNGVKNFVLASSAAVYGNKNDLCIETDKPNPQSPYAHSKIEGERLCKEYSNVYGMSTVVLRYFNVHGERQNPDSEYSAVIARFTNMLKNKKPLTIFGTGRQTRDFIEVSEVVKANMIMGCQPNMEGEVFNIATGNSMNILEVVERIKNQLKIQPVGINFMPARSGDIEHSRADCTKYKKFTKDMKNTFVLKNNQTNEKSL
ncbi:NAD-dependent epimerase/dehydratase family protein [Candidatus Babeliales bacterium]|nr:NAD-dependent epimerase/dehydratase family protein [Candidatus Babeliales bacterium]